MPTAGWLLGAALLSAAPGASQSVPAPKNWRRAGDHRNIPDQLGISALRPGPNDESTANPLPDYPAILKLIRTLSAATA